MEKTEQIKYKYTCRYCRKVYNKPVKECAACGATDFIETSYLVSEQRNKKLLIIITVPAAIILILLFTMLKAAGTAFKGVSDEASTDFTVKEYAYSESLLTDPEMSLGKTSSDTKINDNIYIRVTGSYNDLTENICNNIYTNQLQRYTFSVPCDIEIKDGDFHAEITALDFSYFKSDSYVDANGSFAGKTDKDISIYLVDAEGNKDKLLIADYNRMYDEYSGIGEYLCSDESVKAFSINNILMEYKAVIIEYGDTSSEFELDYSRASGTIEYCPLANN